MSNNSFVELTNWILNQIFIYVVIIILVWWAIVWLLCYIWILDLDKILNMWNIKPKKKYNPFYLVSKWKVFTNTELTFFKALNKIIDNENYFLFTKIRLVDLVNIRKAEYWKYITIFNKLSKKHIDFVIADKYWNIKVLIELDDKYHNSNKAKINDKFKNELMEYLKIPLLRYNVWKYYDLDRVRDLLISKV